MMSAIVSFVIISVVLAMYEHSGLHKTGSIMHDQVSGRNVQTTVLHQPR